MEEKVRKLLEKHKDDMDLTNEEDYVEPGWDWSDADLEGWNLKGLRLSNLNNEANFINVNLIRANLQNANLSWANLQGASLIFANLRNALLLESNLEKANLMHANLNEARLVRTNLLGANLEGANLQKAILTGAVLQDTSLMRANLKDAKFNKNTALHNANLFNCNFENSTIKNAYKQLDKVVIQEREKKYILAKEVYLMLKNYFKQEGMYELSGEYYYREKLMETKCFRKDKEWLKWIGNHILHKIAGFGERPQWVLLWWAFIILLWGFFYWIFNGIMVNSNISYNPTPLEALYFSGVTFTTLGFGDIAPKQGIFQLFALVEALLGAIFMAMFIFVFARKMIR